MGEIRRDAVHVPPSSLEKLQKKKWCTCVRTATQHNVVSIIKYIPDIYVPQQVRNAGDVGSYMRTLHPPDQDLTASVPNNAQGNTHIITSNVIFTTWRVQTNAERYVRCGKIQTKGTFPTPPFCVGCASRGRGENWLGNSACLVCCTVVPVCSTPRP